jgi:hypothetical protein
MANSVNVGTISNGTTFTIPATNTTTNQIYISNGGSGGSGYAYSTSATQNNNTIFSNSSGKEVMKIPAGDEATVQITGKIKWNGEDLQDRLERIENLLHIPSRDIIMEEKYTKLKKLWNDYYNALEEYKTWERLKGSK